MKKLLLSAVLGSLASLAASAGYSDAVDVGGLYFSFDKTNKTATLESKAFATMQYFYEGDIVVPASVTYQGETYTVTTIGDYAFSDYDENLTSVTLPESITTLKSYAFDGTVLTELVIPNSVKTIGSNVFEYSALKKISIGSGVESIGGNAFLKCDALTEVSVLGDTPCTITANTFPTDIKSKITLYVPKGKVSAYQTAANWNGFKEYKETEGSSGPDPSKPVDVLYNGILYEVTPATGTAKVATVYSAVESGRLSAYYTGDITIADKVPYDGKDYTVTALGDECFWQCTVTSITLPETLEKLGWESFYNIKTMPSITIPDKVAVIEHGDFYAAYLQEITLGAGVNTIEYDAFAQMNLITRMTVKAETPPTMDASALSAANKAKTELYVPAGKVEAYKTAPNWGGFKAYYEIGYEPMPTHVVVDGIHYELTESAYTPEEDALQCYVDAPVTSGDPVGNEYSGVVTIPESFTYRDRKFVVTRINTRSFYMQSGLTEVKIPATVNIIGQQAFQESGITSITLPKGMKRMDNYVFRKCTALKTLTVSDITPFDVSSGTFMTITSTCKLYVPRGTVNAYKAAQYWKDFTDIEEDPESPVLPESITLSRSNITRLVGDTYTLTATILPEDATDKTVEWKSLNPDVATVDRNGTVTFVAPGRANIEAICEGRRTLSAICVVLSIAKNVTADGLQYRLEFDEDNKIADAYVIRDNNYAGDIVIPAKIQAGVTFNVVGIDQNAFALNENVTSVTIPASIRSIGFNAFRLCSGLRRVNISDISAWANIDFKDKLANPIQYSRNLYLNGNPVTDINIAAGTESIKDFVFQGLSTLRTLTIAEGLKSIGQYSFAECTSITQVKLPESIEKIGMSAFSDCSALESINLPSGLKSIETGILARTAIKEITVPEGVTYINNQAFQGCAELTDVTLPSTLELIYMMVFDKCSKLSGITSMAVTPPAFFQADGFGDYALAFDPAIFGTCVLSVPAESVSAYRDASGWKNFIHVKAYEPTVEGEKAEVNGLWYEFFKDSKTATLIYNSAYAGEVTVPAKVIREEVEYDVTAVGEGAFEGLAEVTSVSLPESVTKIGARALSGTGIDVFAVPQGVRVISEEMLSECGRLISVSLPDELERIDLKAFWNSPRIRYIFCNNLGTGDDHIPPVFSTYSGDPTDYGQAFSTDIWPDCMLVIPADMFMNYKKAAGWKNFRMWGYWHDSDVMPEEFAMTPNSISGHVDDTFSTLPTVTPSDATVFNYVITGLDESIATITPGKDASDNVKYDIKLIAEGETTITVYCGLLKAECKIICDNTIGVDDIFAEEGEIRWFDLNGVELKAPVKGLPMIRVKDRKAERVIIF